MTNKDQSDFPDGLSPFGSLPGQDSQPTPEELESYKRTQDSMDRRLKGFIDFDEVISLDRPQKLMLVNNICERFVFGHLSGMNGTIGYSDTLKPEIKDRTLVAKYRSIATRISGLESQPLPIKDIETLLNIGSVDSEGNQIFFESIIRPPKHEPNPNNPYLTNEAFVYHDAKMLDYLIKELYIEPNKHIVGFSKN